MAGQSCKQLFDIVDISKRNLVVLQKSFKSFFGCLLGIKTKVFLKSFIQEFGFCQRQITAGAGQPFLGTSAFNFTRRHDKVLFLRLRLD